MKRSKGTPERETSFSPGTTQTDYWDAVFDTIPFPIYVMDVETYKVVTVNRVMRAQRSPDLTQPCYRAIYQQEAPCIFCPLKSLNAAQGKIGASVVFEHFNDLDDRWYQLQESLVSWFDGRLVKHSIAVDISVLKETQNALSEAHAALALKTKVLERLSTIDDMTGLGNRRYLDRMLVQEGERARRYQVSLSVILGDIDHFKAINDRWGHHVGDEVLLAMAEVLRHNVRKVDILGRWGGEEFLILCPETHLTKAYKLAEKLCEAVARQDFAQAGHQTISFGVAQYAGDEPLEKTVQRADAALYAAKREGRNRVVLAE